MTLPAFELGWFLLSVACAFLTATTAMLSKLLLKKNSVFFVGWARFLFALPVFVLLLWLRRPIMHLEPAFWKIVVILLPFELAAFLVFLKALKISPLSLTFPLLGLTPLFAVLFSYILLREAPNAAGIAGIILVAFGAYLLNINTVTKGLLEPIKAIYREKGSLLMLLVAFVYGVTSVLGKKAVMLSSPLSFAAIYYTIFLIIFTPLAAIKGRKDIAELRQGLGKNLLLMLALGSSFAAAMILHFKAVLLVNVSYMISVKRVSLLIGVGYGALIFKERNIKSRLLGSFVMLAGVLLLGFSQ